MKSLSDLKRESLRKRALRNTIASFRLEGIDLDEEHIECLFGTLPGERIKMLLEYYTKQ